MMAAQKGGVGKSTLTTNVAAALVQRNKRVLVIDMDYQGTLSAQMIRDGDLKASDDAGSISCSKRGSTNAGRAKSFRLDRSAFRSCELQS